MHTLLIAGLLALAPVGPAVDPEPDLDLGAAVAALEAPTAAERFAAERWLVAHLGEVEAPALLEVLDALDGDDGLGQEATWRLGRALGDARGGLGLALELAVGDLVDDARPSLDLQPVIADTESGGGRTVQARRLGGLALDQALAGWHAGLERSPVSGQELELFLREERERSGWRPLLHRPDGLAESVDALNRRGDLPVPLVLAPELAERLARERFQPGEGLAGSPLEGPWDRVLVELAGRAGVGLEAVLRFEDEADELAWLRLVPRGDEGTTTGATQLRLALTDLARGRPAPLGSGRADGAFDDEVPAPAVHLQLSARFLAGVGWQVPLVWLEQRWWQDRDPAALAGLLEAAGRGRFAPRLLTPAGLERLLDEAARLDRQGGNTTRLGERLARAFARLPRHLDGADTADLLADGWREGGDLERHLRLVGLAATGDGTGLDLARAVLAGEAGGETQWVCLTILGQARAADPDIAPVGELAGAGPLLQLVPDRLAPDELARVLGRAGATLPADLAHGRPSTLRAALLARVLLGELEEAARVLVEDLELAADGSWAMSLEPTLQGRRVEELAEGLEGLVLAGELLSVRALLGLAALEAGAATGLQDQPRDDPGDLVADVPEPTALDRLVLLAGAMDPGRQSLLIQDLLRGGEASVLHYDLDALAALAASPAGGPVRVVLLERLDAAFTSPRPRDGAEVLPAIERCLVLLWARSDDRGAEELIQEVTRVAAGHSGSGHPLVTRVLWRRWPPAPPGTPVDLDRLTAP